MTLPLSPIQKAVARDIVRKFDSHRSQVLAWYTGSGKTNVFLAVARELLKQNPSAHIGISTYLHTNIKEQTSARAHAFIGDHNKIEYGKVPTKSKRVHIFNPQSLFYRDDLGFKFDYFIIDEAHIAVPGEIDGGYIDTIFKNHCTPGVKVLGVTATPWDLFSTSLFKDAIIHERGMDKGLNEDERIQDFKIHAEEIELDFKGQINNRSGEVSSQYIKKHFSFIRDTCVKKVEAILEKRSSTIGKKCLIIVPPGNDCGIAAAVAKLLGKSAIALTGGKSKGGHQYRQEESKELSRFYNDPAVRFLIVVHKCQIGFDMPELESTIDLTMSRNIGLLIQRWGRLARKDVTRSGAKHYYYVFDQSLSIDHVEWLLSTSVEYAMCRWDRNYSSQSLRRRPTRVQGKGSPGGYTTTFTELMEMHDDLETNTYRTITFSEECTPRGSWTPDALVKEAKRYSSRTELSEKNRYVYNMLLKHHITLLSEIFPIKNALGKWNLKTALRAAKACKNRAQFRKQYSGAYKYICENGHVKELDAVLPSSLKKWDLETVLRTAKKYDSAMKFKIAEPGAYYFLRANDRLGELQKIFPTFNLGRPGRHRSEGDVSA